MNTLPRQLRRNTDLRAQRLWTRIAIEIGTAMLASAVLLSCLDGLAEKHFCQRLPKPELSMVETPFAGTHP
jgi:hypothetical protein